MPWDISSVENHIKGLSKKAKELWATVANSALKRCLDKGGDAKECEVSAIRQANSVAQRLEDSKMDTKRFYYLTDIGDITLDEKQTAWIDIFREGKWKHPKYGWIKGDKQIFNDFIDNWKGNILGRDVAIDKTHNPSEGAVGWVKDMKIEGDRLRALIEFTPWGVDLVQNKGFRYFSPEFTEKYQDKENPDKVHKNVLIGGGVTLRPFLTNMSPVVLSEDADIAFPIDRFEDDEDIGTAIDAAIEQVSAESGYGKSELREMLLNHLAKQE